MSIERNRRAPIESTVPCFTLTFASNRVAGSSLNAESHLFSTLKVREQLSSLQPFEVWSKSLLCLRSNCCASALVDIPTLRAMRSVSKVSAWDLMTNA
jgi:hypothetical protein